MEKIKKILIGTHNEGKFREISSLLPKNIEKISPKSLNIESPVEDGKTFVENSQIKAEFFCKKSNLITLSDDSGLEINYLNGEPGIFSSRWSEKFGSFDNAMTEILKKMSPENKDTSAQFVCSLTIQWPDGNKFTETGIIKGNISSKKGKNGFGYDPIFVPKGYSQTFAEMEYEKKLFIDHRYIAFKKLEKKIKVYLV
jgi:XTP/dITP diphosphohydrolase